jgi:Skp family chaperone for outer membrane proteins
MRRVGACTALALALMAQPFAVLAQTSALPPTALVTLDQEQLFTGTLYGKAVQAQFDTEAAALLAENRKIDAALEAEERALTDQRAKMQAEAFRPLAEAFDEKANSLRKAQDAKSRDLARVRDDRRQTFFRAIGPIIGDYMVERGAVAVLDKASIIVSLGSIDITQGVIERIDSQLGKGPEATPSP